MVYSEKERIEKLNEIIDDTFLEKLRKVVHLIRWEMDYGETWALVLYCHDIKGVEVLDRDEDAAFIIPDDKFNLYLDTIDHQTENP